MTGQSGSIRVSAPAKINLILKVLGRLPNGYHELWSMMHTVDLFDHLSIRIDSSSQQIQLSCQPDNVPSGEDNLVYRAAAKVLKRAGLDVGVDIQLEKSIPMGAGLGGGSSDAAATVYGLVQLLGLGWSLSEMAALGEELGSDVPFFFYGPQAMISGWGETVAPVRMTGSRWIVLVNPGFPVETGWAYRQIAESRNRAPALPAAFGLLQEKPSLDITDVIPLMENDFEAALFPSIPRLAEIKRQLCDLGAEVALLSGSGSTVFGIFCEKAAAVQAGQMLVEDSQAEVFCVPTSSKGFALV